VNPKKFMEQRDYNHSRQGWILGQVMLVISFTSLGLFFAWRGNEDSGDTTGYLNKLTNIFFGTAGLFAAIIGIRQIDVSSSES
jgi:hypothetical protein